MIEFQNVGFTYRTAEGKRGRRKKARESDIDWGNDPGAYWALHDVSFALADGEFLGIAGHTGSGKSTLIQHMNGLLHPLQGRVLVDGADIADKGAAAAAREHVGMVFQYPEHQLFAATVFDDVAFGPRNMGLSPEEVERRYAQAMQLVELNAEALRSASPFELSGGQQRRVAFAGVLAMGPKTLILDEPVAGLDPKSREDFLRFIQHMHTEEGMTVVMVSHDMNDLARLCDRILVLNRGEVFALGTPEEVFADAEACKRIGLGVPATQHLSNELAKRGVRLPRQDGLPTLESLADAIASIVPREGSPRG
ncbi:energy-coupling factor transporter ATPase [Curtanaerobium respiraculi]|uniref:energy-coupling factor transporter ATPase n=1 Tax=Curtanaerobium respiraculi TaxID=2949669 RepID=UPI0024B356FE|nr:energy-coupling factor transporter ATPase [Curtanaerobium respiraculi]